MSSTNQVPDFEPQSQGRIEVIAYDIVSKNFRLNAEYGQNNGKVNVKEIAEKFGCELEFHVSKFPEDSYEKLIGHQTLLQDKFKVWKV